MILRHSIDLTKLLSRDTYHFYIDKITKSIQRIVDKLPINLHGVSGSGLTIALPEIILGYSEYIYTCLIYNIDIGIAHFNRVYSKEDNLTIRILNKFYSISRIDSTFGADSFEWSNLVNAAIICRDKDRIASLLSIPIWKILEYDEPFHRLFSEYQANIILGNTQEWQKLYYFLKEDAESNTGLFIGREESKYIFVDGRSERIKALYLPLVNLYKYAIEGNSNSFNEILEQYLIEKRNYIIKEKMEADFRYWIDYPTLGVCSFAFDRGISIHVESEYIPSRVYKGEFDRSKILF